MFDKPNDNFLKAAHDGVLWCYIIETDKSAQLCSIADIKAYQGSGYTWVHMQSDEIDSALTLQKLGLAQARIESLCALETRPKAQDYADGMLIYLRGINRNPEADPEDMVSLRLWLRENQIISLRRKDRRLLSVLDVKENIDNGEYPPSPIDLLVNIVNCITDRISETVDDLDDELTEFESRDVPQHESRERLMLARRQAAALRRYLAPQRDALEAITRVSKHITDNQVHDIRMDYDRMTRYVEDLDLAKERAMVLQDELRNRIAEQQGMRMYVLSLVTAIFLPLSFLTGIFGMNVAGLPGTESPEAFTILACSMVVIAIGITAYMLWKKWM
ncbi:CorA family divalent cation transporter [Paraglaciecola sp.]|uniref:CorA family divalent cation transporter n=1 Tax=Paraglaciecola sp. TaxID=1920173 RepID=UPI0030F3CB9B